ncbi:unnamed protein product [Prunus armeniaca]
MAARVAQRLRFQKNNSIDMKGLFFPDLARWDLPRWATLLKAISSLDYPKKRFVAQMQEAYRKDVKRAFGILQARWAIVWGPTLMWCKDNLHSIMMMCIILHNMIVEDEYEYIEEESNDEDACPQ